MAGDVLSLTKPFGHDRFAVVGHDRGSYVAFRLAMDHPDTVSHLAVLDRVPIGEALARADAWFAAAWWHWFFLAQPELPERLIAADPDAWYGTGQDRAAAMGQGNYADYLRAIHDPAVQSAMRQPIHSGHHMAEDAPEDLAAALADFSAGPRNLKSIAYRHRCTGEVLDPVGAARGG